MPRHHATVCRWHGNWPIAGSDLEFPVLPSQNENFTDFVRCFPVGGQLSLFFSEASEVVLIYMIKYE